MDLRARNIFYARTALLAALIGLAACAPREPPSEVQDIAPAEVPAQGAGGLRLSRSTFTELANWPEVNLSDAHLAFARSCSAITEMPDGTVMGGAGYGGTAAQWQSACAAAATISSDDSNAARVFFETAFVPYRVAQGENFQGLFTGYFEPELSGSRLRQGAFQTPLYGLPSDLVSIDLGLFRENFDGQRLAGRLENGRLVPYDTRAVIARNGLNQAEALLYVDDAIDAFFLQIQGSGRVRLEDGSVVRAAYAGQNGHPYTAIGAVLIREGEMAREEVSMQSIRAWLSANPAQAQGLLDQNESYIFFSIEPLDDPALGARGTAGVPLTAEASLAVDASAHPLGAPVWLETTIPSGGENESPFHRLLIAQDTGGAINGAVRGDVYWGVGEGAGEIAGRMRSMGEMTVLLPRDVADRIGEIFPPSVAAP